MRLQRKITAFDAIRVFIFSNLMQCEKSHRTASDRSKWSFFGPFFQRFFWLDCFRSRFRCFCRLGCRRFLNWQIGSRFVLFARHIRGRCTIQKLQSVHEIFKTKNNRHFTPGVINFYFKTESQSERMVRNIKGFNWLSIF